MRDRDVRVALLQSLDEQHRDDPETLTIDELALCGRVRVDVAVVNGYLAGFELKSERDTLRRLAVQVEVYSSVLDQATLVVAEKHHRHALGMVPSWWGITIARSFGVEVVLEIERDPQQNRAIDPMALVTLLWREEALDELEVREAADGVRSKPKAAVWTRLVESVEFDELRAVVRRRLKCREGWRPDRPQL